MNDRVTISELMTAKRQGQALAVVSCYDCTTARLVSQAGVEMILVGDSAAQLILGYDSTLPATMDLMVTLTAAVRRGAPNAYLIGDMPFLSYQPSRSEAIRNAGRFLTEANAQMVKIEVTGADLDTVKAVSDAGVAVMAHIGIRPQRLSMIGRFRAEATTAELGMELIALAEQMIDAGARALLIEGTAAEVAQIVTERSEVPVISCGSGPGCDGQVLVAPDILGLTEGKIPKFSRSYADLGRQSVEAFQAYARDIRDRTFPDAKHCYHMKPGEMQRLKALMHTEP